MRPMTEYTKSWSNADVVVSQDDIGTTKFVVKTPAALDYIRVWIDPSEHNFRDGNLEVPNDFALAVMGDMEEAGLTLFYEV